MPLKDPVESTSVPVLAAQFAHRSGEVPSLRDIAEAIAKMASVKSLQLAQGI